MVTIFFVNNWRGTISAWENEGYGAGREYQCVDEMTRVNVFRVKYIWRSKPAGGWRKCNIYHMKTWAWLW